jgi:transcriptional regulator with XRE-family HTH domain
MSATTSHLRTKRTAKEVLPRLLAEHKPPISRNKLSRLLDISLGHVSRACSPNHHERFSGEALARIAAVLDLPEDYFLESRYAYVAHRMAEDNSICDMLYDLLVAAADEQDGEIESEDESVSEVELDGDGDAPSARRFHDSFGTLRGERAA